VGAARATNTPHPEEGIMGTYPPSVQADAANRAWRTFAQGLLFDVAVAVVAVLVTAFTSIEWTSTYWLALASSLGKTILVAVVSYAARKLTPPAV
jgi:hypothetical protein